MKICGIGNSVAASRTEEEAPLAGRGQYLDEFLGAGCDVRSYARDAMTLRGYYTERFAALLTLVSPGDLVLVAFGHVEKRITRLNRYHGPREFKEYLRLYVAALRTEGVPILVAPAARCVFDVAGRPVDTHDGSREPTLEAAAELDCPVIDLTASTTQLLAELGPTRARGLYRWLDPGEHPGHPQGIIDASHFNQAGAREVARLVVSGLAGRGTEKVMVLEQGRLITEAPVQDDGIWRVTHAHDWRPGSYAVEFVGVFSLI